VSSRSVAEPVAVGAHLAALPNLLSLGRIGLVPVIVALVYSSTPLARGIAGAVFVVACITDFLDGWLARRHGIASGLGQFLDPLADKLLVASALIMMVGHGPDPRVPAWMVAVLVARELAVTGLRGIAASEGIPMAAEQLGKYKMVFQMFAVDGLLIHHRYGIPGTTWQIDFAVAGMIFMWVSLVFSVWSGLEYAQRVLRHAAFR
jgi:CDP-diacylglycerol---glycerol-3-phosphate 3-phosphatidyltransferase